VYILNIYLTECQLAYFAQDFKELLSPHVIQTINYASNDSSRAVVPTTKQRCLQLFVGTMISGNSDSLYYANDVTCDYS